jgi:hypothetical protein
MENSMNKFRCELLYLANTLSLLPKKSYYQKMLRFAPAPRCVSVQGKEFCRELTDKERRLEEELDGKSAVMTPLEEQLFLRGIEYVLPGRDDAGASKGRRLRGKLRVKIIHYNFSGS